MAKPQLRCTVPIVGTGLNRWLLGSHRFPILTDWWDLMSNVAWSESLLPNEQLEKIFQAKQAPTFAWEALLHAYKVRNGFPEKPEDKMLSNLSKRIKAESKRVLKISEVKDRRERFLDAMGSGDRVFSIVSLNYDSLLTDKDGKWKEAGSEDMKKHNRTCLVSKYHQTKDYRVWFPHGSTEEPKDMVAGIWRYTRASAHVVNATNHFKKETESLYYKDNKKIEFGDTECISKLNQHRLSDDTPTWVSDAINAPLLLLGVGCTQEETNIWTFLHRRAREHQRLKTKVPPIWRFSCKKENPSLKGHWASLSAGLNIIDLELGVDWDDAWSNLLSILESDSSLFA